MAWLALQVRTRGENLVALALRQKGYETFLPQYECAGRRRPSSRPILLPLFPAYVFCRFDCTIPGRIVSTPGVMRIVGVGNHPVPVSEEELLAVRKIVASRAPAKPWPYLAPGHTVKVASGALAGLEGTLTELKGRSRIVVSMNLLRRSVAVEIDRCLVVPCNHS